MKTFLKAQTSSFVATIADFLLTIACVEFLKINVVLAAAIGNVGGAVVNFFMGRTWVFDSTHRGIGVQAFRYALVWFGYMALSTFGIYLLETFTPIHYVISKAVVSFFLAVTYNYFLQKKFVFN